MKISRLNDIIVL